MPFWEHFEELRKRVLTVIAFFALFFFMIFLFSRDLLGYMEAVFAPGAEFIVRRPTEYLWLMTKLSAYLSVIVILPLIVYEILVFSSSGLYDNERSFLRRAIAVSAAFVAMGVTTSTLVLKRLLPYLAGLSENAGTEARWSIELVLDFVIKSAFTFSIFSLLPVVMYFMMRAGIVDSENMKKWRKYVYSGAFFFCALLLPQPFTLQLIFFIIFVMIYEIFIVYGKRISQEKIRSD
jgi:sec-independent protein translocase protein TatC